MYLVRRVFKIKPGTTFQAASLIHQMGKLYEEAGQRSPYPGLLERRLFAGAGRHPLYGVDRGGDTAPSQRGTQASRRDRTPRPAASRISGRDPHRVLQHL